MKICNICGKEKIENAFRLIICQRTGKKYLARRCKKCDYAKRRKHCLVYGLHYRLKHKHGITCEQRELILKSQNGRCKICDKILDGNICIDHNSTGEIRGLLCRNCNTLLSRIESDPGWVKRIIDYIKNANTLKETK